MTGKTDNPEISFDIIKISEKLKENIEKQKEEIQQIIKEDILQKDSVSNIEEGEKPRLEWDDEDN